MKTKPIKANLPDAQMSVNSILTKDYERNDIFAVPENKANSKPNKANSKPNKANSNPMSKQLVGARPRWPESAKMAQIVANRGVITVQAESIKKLLKKPNLLTIKMLSSSHQPILATGTYFAHLEPMR